MISDAEEKLIKRKVCQYIRALSREKTEEMEKRLIALIEWDIHDK